MKKPIKIFILGIIIIALVITLVNFNYSQEETIKIGATFPTTGSMAFLGIPESQGVKLAEKEINSNGGINGKKLEVIYEDNKGEVKNAVSIIHKFIDVDNTDIIISAFTHIVSAINPITSENKKILIYSSTIPKFARQSKYTFQDYSNLENDGKVLAEHFINKNIKEVVFIQVLNEAYDIFYESFKKEYESKGGKIISYNTFSMEETDFKTILLKSKSYPNNLIIGSGFPQHVIPILKQMKENKMETWKVGIPLCAFPQTAKSVGEILESTDAVCTWFSFYAEDTNSKTIEFVNKFQEEYGILPDYSAAYTYDQLNLASIALKKCDKRNNAKDTNCISEELLKIKNYEGVAGKVSFDNSGASLRPTFLLQYKNGKWVKI